MNENIVPIAILHRNEVDNLSKMIDAIKKNTNIRYHIFIVDNNSNDIDTRHKIQDFKNLDNITLIESKHNNWVLGFNLALNHKKWPKDSKYFVFSDSDIVVPGRNEDNQCWLERMILEMEKYACIGQLGISLKVDDIDNVILYKYATEQRQKFNENPKIGDNFIAPVDTTLAIYRNNFFIGSDFRFNIGHASLARPYYFTCRTAGTLEAKHLGWYLESSLNVDSQKLKDKIRCFALYGGGVASDLLKECNYIDVMFYKTLRPISIIYWGFWVIIKNFNYVATRFPRKINEIQSKFR